jgi:succinoglycan biosynthesis transport protein ExoP
LVIDELNEQKPLDVGKYWQIAIRRRWWILGPFFTAGLVAFAVALLWPPEYQSQAVVLVEEQKIPTKYVTPNTVTDVESRLQSMKEQILSRTRLEELIRQLNLYGRERSHMTMDELVDKMRSNINITVVQSGDRRDDQPLAFRIYFSAQSPYVAQQVNNELTHLFINKSLEARAQQSMGTTSFLDSQLKEAKKDLEDQEKQLSLYKMKYLGELPQQEQSNLQILNSMEMQLQSVTDSIGRAEQQKIYLRSLRSEYQAMRQSSKTDMTNPGPNSMSVADEALRDLQKQLSELEAKYTPQHPDVLKVKEEIAQWEQLKTKNADSTASAPAGTADNPMPGPVDQPAFAEVDSRLKAVDAEIANNKQQAEKLRKQIDDIRARLSLTPVREQQLAEVTRNYQNSHEYYQSLLQKELESQLASNLDQRQEGEQFRIIDLPSLPDKPIKPNRPLILLGGWLFGLCLGLGAAGASEFINHSLRTAHELQELTSLPILVRIPVFYTARQRKTLRLRNLVEIGLVSIFVLVSLVVAIYTYRLS